MKTFAAIFYFLLAFCLTATGQDTDSVKYMSLEPYDFHMAYLREDNSLLIDVREFFEYRSSRIKGAINIPSSGNLDFSADTINKKKALFLYCTTGFRSKRVAKFFSNKGFSKVYSLDGGITAWKKDGMPVEKKKIKRNRKAT